jgi:hypothetical protein
MVNLFRKHQQPLMIVFTFLLIIAFLLLYNLQRSTGRSEGEGIHGRIYGHTVPQAEAEREGRKFLVAQRLRLIDLLNGLVGQAETQEQAINLYVWNILVMRHEAERLQIEPTQDEVKVAIMGIPGFHNAGGAFDPGIYANFVQEELAAQGLSAEQMEEVVRDDLRLQKIKAILGATFVVPESAFRTVYSLQNQKLDISVIRFNLSDFEAGVQVSDDDAKKAYDQNKDIYQTGEKRIIRYVTFALDDKEKALTGKERTEALQKLANKAQDFTQAMLEKGANFDDVAKKFNVPVTVTPAFSATDPDPKTGAIPSLVEGAFRLTKEQPDGDVAVGENNFYVPHLDEIQTSKQMTLEEAKTQVVEQIKQSRAHELLNVKSADARNKIQADLTAGKSFADAVTAAGLKADVYPPFSLAEPDLDKPDVREVTVKAVEMSEGQLSEFIPTPDGGLLIHLDKREPLDEAKYAKDKVLMEPSVKQQKLHLVFSEWLRKARDAARIELPRSASAPSGAPGAPGGQGTPGQL